MRGSLFPDYVMIQTHTFCNSNCIMCPHHDVSKEVSQGKMDNNLFKNIINECSQHKNVKRILLYFMNEPLIDKNIVEKINYAKTKNPQALVHIVSNGALLNNIHR